MLRALLCAVLLSAGSLAKAAVGSQVAIHELQTSLLQASFALSDGAAEGRRQPGEHAVETLPPPPLPPLVEAAASATAAPEWPLHARVLLVLGIFAAFCLAVLAIVAPSSAEPEEAEEAQVAAASKGPARCRRAMLWARLLTSVTSLAEGYALSCAAGVIVTVEAQMGLTQGQVAWFQGVIYLAMPFTMLAAGPIADEIGRVPTVGISYCILIVGSLLLATATGFQQLVLGRAVEALAMGLGFGAIATYMPEVSPKDSRGRLCGMEEVLICLGTVLGQVTNRVLMHADAWRWTFAFGSLLPSIMLVLILLGLLEESPRFLHLKGRHAEAEKSLRRLLSYGEAQEVLASWEAEGDSATTRASWYEALFPPPGPGKSAWLVGFTVMAFSSFCGIAVVAMYMPMVLAEQVGESAAFGMVILAFSARTLVVMFSSFFLIDSVGRRPLLLVSLFGTTVGTSALAVSYLVEPENALLAWKLAGYLIFLMSFSIGLGPVAWAYVSEALETRVRGRGVSAALAFSRIFSWGLVTSFPSASNSIGVGGCYLCLAIVNVIALGFVYAFAAETKGAALESVKDRFPTVSQTARAR
mmetsp:Transcript_84642/g.218147  ORF Transcript_84642/g.218147 Transcript_84642/m.218147 type:complete len:584 (+) Transcript_84642:97-1848(+)